MVESDRLYRRAAFSTRLRRDRLYTASHAWLLLVGDGIWRVGYTKFATRLLGEPVEYDIEVTPGSEVERGQAVGWVEGFKAVTDLYCPMAGRFERANEALSADMTLLHRDPYGKGWLYELCGKPGEDCVEVDGYVAVLDATIDKMMGTQG